MLQTVETMLNRSKNFSVVTTYANGRVKTHETATLSQAENWATGERRKIGRDLIDRETNSTVRIVDVKVERIQ